jgi:hypothetical protein
MTTTDPNDPQAWKQAEAIAQAAAGAPVHKKTDRLPFLFFTDDSRIVLVHHGAVMKARGPAAVGGYLRDLGIIDGKGPTIEDIVYLLEVLDALPPITDVPPTQYVLSKSSPLTSRVEHDGKTGKVVLSYILGDGPRPRGDENARPTKLVARAVLEIPKAGDAAWKPIEKSTWSP